MDLKQYRSKLIGSNDERAVSPVIGVILMVAITVILAAVIAAFVLDMGPTEVDPSASVGIDGDGSSEVTVTLESTGTNTDGIAVSSGESSGIESSSVLETTGASVTFNSAEGDLKVYAYSGDLSDSDNPENADNIAIIEEFTVA